MVKLRILLLLPAALLGLAAAVPTTFSAQAEEKLVGRSVTLAGRKLSCGKADIYVDRDLPSEGGAGDTILILNPDMMNQQPPTVRLFVFTHECGHITVGDSELDADCFAVNRGVSDRWLDRKGLKEVCDSFEGAPETDTHPSAKRRCTNLDRCFAKAMAEQTPIAPRRCRRACRRRLQRRSLPRRPHCRRPRAAPPASRRCCRLGAAPIRWT